MNSLKPQSFSAKLSQMNVFKMKALYKRAKENYYNKEGELLTDEEFDSLEDTLRGKVPGWKPLKETGASISPKLGKKSAFVLKHPMPSLNKVKPENPDAVMRACRRISEYDPLVRLSEKLDGSSIQVIYKKGKLTNIVTRGDGEIGKDVSFLKDHLSLPKELKGNSFLSKTTLVIRMEAVISKEKYAKHWADSFDSGRIMASSLLNRHDAHPALKDLDFVALQVLEPDVSLQVGLNRLQKEGLLIANGKLVSADHLSVDELVKACAYLRKHSDYETDGVVIYTHGIVKSAAQRPDHAVAFKVNEMESAQLSTVVDVVWKPSPFGTLVPKAIIKPIQFGNVTVKQAALHNAGWAKERGIGPGAKVKVLRSGDIIPKIVSVEKTSVFPLPKFAEFGKWEWDDTKTHITLVNSQQSEGVLHGKFSRFFAKLKLEKVAGGLAKKLIDAGVESTAELPHLTEADFAALPGVKSQAKSFAKEMSRVRNGEFSLPDLMIASGVFDRGVGGTRLESLQNSNPELLLQSAVKNPLLQKTVAGISGCGPAFAALYVRGLPEFWHWMKRSGATWADKKKVAAKKGPLLGKGFTWTGYRDKGEEERIEALGGSVVPFGSRTSVLFHKEGGKASSKIDKASERGVTVTAFDAFMKRVK